MAEHSHTGSCHCGNIQFTMLSQMPLSELTPRECDCDFCTKHGVRPLSDPGGSLRVAIRSQSDVHAYRQGAQLADMLICRICGVAAVMTYESEKGVYGVLNARSLDDYAELCDPVQVSPKKLNSSDKIQRWKSIWIPDVELRYGG